MDELNQTVLEAFEFLKNEFGTPYAIEENGPQVFLLNNCVLILSFIENELKIDFIGGKPFEMDKTISVFEKN